MKCDLVGVVRRVLQVRPAGVAVGRVAEQPAAVGPGRAVVGRHEVVRVEADGAREVVGLALAGEAEDVVVGRAGGVGEGLLGLPTARVAGVGRDAVRVSASELWPAYIARYSAIGADQEGGRVVIVRPASSPSGVRATRRVRQLKCASSTAPSRAAPPVPAGVGDRADQDIPGGRVDDRALVLEPGPCAVVVDEREVPGDVVELACLRSSR